MAKIDCHIMNVIKGNIALFNIETEVYLSVAISTKKLFEKAKHETHRVFGEFLCAGRLRWFYVDSGKQVDPEVSQAINKAYLDLREHDRNLNRIVKFSKDLNL